jgi:pyridoxine/pyridoxamine 5'-phosphate oxidase
MTKAQLYGFMSAQRYGVLGSVSPEGEPQSALVGIAVSEDLEIVFDTLNTTRKYRNLIAHSRACLSIGWEGEKTVQFEGEAWLPEGDELARCQEIYYSAWPEGRSHLDWAGLVYFAVRPRWIRFSDYDARPPLIDEQVF